MLSSRCRQRFGTIFIIVCNRNWRRNYAYLCLGMRTIGDMCSGFIVKLQEIPNRIMSYSELLVSDKRAEST